MGKIIQFPQKEHDTCPKCGNLNGPFERLGSGICNECLGKPRRKGKRSNQHA